MIRSAIRIFLLAAFWSSLSPLAHGQFAGFEFSYGLGSYQMKDMQKYNDYIVSALPFPSKVTSNFPSYMYFKGSFLTQIEKNLALGVSGSFHSTGSRVSARDYSADYHYDNLLKSNMTGLFLRQHLWYSNTWLIDGQIEGGCILSRLSCNEYFMMFDSVQIDQKDSFKSLHGYAEPDLRFAWVKNKISIGCSAGYMFQFGKRGFYIDDPDNSQVVNPATMDYLKPEWDGIRLSLSISYSFSKHHKPVPTTSSL